MKNTIADLALMVLIVVAGLWFWFAVINHFWPKPLQFQGDTGKIITVHNAKSCNSICQNPPDGDCVALAGSTFDGGDEECRATVEQQNEDRRNKSHPILRTELIKI